MVCFYHPDRPATVTCSDCGKALCSECGKLIQPPTCLSCAETYAHSVKAEMVKNIVISVILGVAGVLLTGNISGVLLAGVPYGWSILTSITPSMFLWLSWVGWLVYFIIKFIVATCIGMVALPIKIYKWVTELLRVKKIQEIVDANSVS